MSFFFFLVVFFGSVKETLGQLVPQWRDYLEAPDPFPLPHPGFPGMRDCKEDKCKLPSSFFNKTALFAQSC